MDQVSVKYTNIFHCKTLRNLHKFGFLVKKNLATLVFRIAAHILAFKNKNIVFGFANRF
jgi:hypothetical protein